MKKLITCIAAILFSAVGWAQAPNPSIVLVASPPSGSCTQNLPDQQVVTTGALYSCQSGTWTAIGGGGTGTVSSIATTGPITGGTITTTGTIACPTCVTSLPLYLDWTFNSGVAATDASPRFLASHTGTIANCYLLTTASDGSTALTFNIFDNGTTIFSGGAQTVAAATSPGTLTTISGLSITSITNNDKMSINITSGTSSWVFTVQCK